MTSRYSPLGPGARSSSHRTRSLTTLIGAVISRVARLGSTEKPRSSRNGGVGGRNGGGDTTGAGLGPLGTTSGEGSAFGRDCRLPFLVARSAAFGSSAATVGVENFAASN